VPTLSLNLNRQPHPKPELPNPQPHHPEPGWSAAWKLVVKVFAYTNHTVLPQPSTSFLIPQPDTLNPQPSTLNEDTLNPKPCKNITLDR